MFTRLSFAHHAAADIVSMHGLLTDVMSWYINIASFVKQVSAVIKLNQQTWDMLPKFVYET